MPEIVKLPSGNWGSQVRVQAPESLKQFSSSSDIPAYGAEIITTPKEMTTRIHDGVYDCVQPDASVMGGISAVMEIFAAAKETGPRVVFRAWGGAAAILASYHAAFAAGGDLVEFPMLDFPLGAEMIGGQATIEGGRL